MELSVSLLEEIDSISKIHTLKRDDIDELMIQVAQRVLAYFRIERLSVWLFNDDASAMVSMGEYDLPFRKFSKNNSLYRKDFPHYFEAISRNEILLAPNVYSNKSTSEFSDNYFKQHQIISLMDIPLRIEGELVGVMCFEKTGKTERVFNEREQTFALSISLIFASNLEARKRRALQHLLEEALKEKDLLIKEIHHRVKNNFSILVSLIRLSKELGKTKDPNVIFEEYEQRITSMLKIHELLYQSQNYTSIDIGDYISELVNEFRHSHPDVYDAVILNKDNIQHLIPTRTAIYFGLIISEIFLNAVKYGLPGTNHFRMDVKLYVNAAGKMVLSIDNNGKTFGFTENVTENSLGLSLIRDLSKEVCTVSIFPDKNSNLYEFVF